MVGIYLITNKVNGHQYVGQSVRIERRWIEHKCPSNQSKGTVLSRAFKKYGNDSFEFSVLEECSEDKLDEREMYYIKTLKPIYNMNEGGTGNKGHHPSERTKLVLSKISKKQWENSSAEHKKFIISHNLTGHRAGYHLTEAQKEHLRECAKQQFAGGMSAEHKAKISAGNRVAMIGNKNGNKPVIATKVRGSGIWGFNSIKYAAHILKCTPHEITDVLHGKRKSTHGYKFETLSKF